MKSIEHAEQVLLMQWWAFNHKLFVNSEQVQLFAGHMIGMLNTGKREINEMERF